MELITLKTRRVVKQGMAYLAKTPIAFFTGPTKCAFLTWLVITPINEAAFSAT